MPKETSSPHDDLKPKTYWEMRASLTEESLYRALAIVASGSAPQLSSLISEHLADWDRLANELVERFTVMPAEPATASGPPAGSADASAGDAADSVAAATRAELDRCVAVLDGLKPTQSLEIDAHRISLAVLEKAIKALRGELK